MDTQCRIKVFGGPRLDTIMGAPTVILHPIVPYTFIGTPAYHPLPGKCGVANARIRVLLAELNVPL